MEDGGGALSNTTLVVIAAIVIAVALHIWGYVNPSHFNWGTHLFSFYGIPMAILSLAVMGVFLFPSAQAKVTTVLDKMVRAFANLPVAVLILVIAAALITGAKLFPAQLHLLGDGAVLLRSNALAAWGSSLERSFANQPLMRLFYHWTLTLHSADTTASPLEIYTFIDLAAGVVFVGILVWFFRKLERPPLEKVLLASFLYLTASTQFFFGYVENYVLQFVIVTLFLMTGWLVLENRLSTAAPITCYLLLVGLHLGFLVLLPSIGFLVFWKMGKNIVKAVLILSGLGVVGVAVVIASGYNLQHLLERFGSRSVDFLQPFTAIGGNFPYPMFSAWHLWDWFNAQLLISPLALVLAAILLILHRKEIDWKKPVLLFLLITTACSLVFTWIINFALGMARDWDLFSTFLVPLLLLDIYLLNLPLTFTPRRYVLAVIAAVSLLHWIPWIGVNASAEKHMARMKLLHNPKLLSLVSQIVYDEALANYFFDNGNYAEARTYYEHLITIENTNPRIIGNIADTYRKLGEKDKYFGMLQRAVVLNSPDPGVYSNLGVEYASRGDTANAILFNERALAIDSDHRLAHANLGILYASQKKFAAAEKHFATAIMLGMRESVLFRYAGDIAVTLEHYDQALRYYDSYLEMVPGDRKILAVRDQVRQAVAVQKKQ